MSKRILALSSSRVGNNGFLADAVALIKNFFGKKVMQIGFIPFASVDNKYDEYILHVRTALAALPHTINLVTHENARTVVQRSDALMVGGGNTFKLLHDIYEAKILDLIRDKVRVGTPYIGWSAGSNITGPTIATTNDMPIIQPQSFNALGLLPFQINPHYNNQRPPGHNGETRDQRLTEFMKLNPGIAVMGLPEGTGLLFENARLTLVGQASGILFLPDENKEPVRREVSPNTNLSYLM